MSSTVLGRRGVRLGLFAAATVALCACDGAPSAMPARSHAANAAMGPGDQGGGASGASVQPAAYDKAGAAQANTEARTAAPSTTDLDADAPRFHGKPIWAANRNHSSQDNADYQFKKNGADVGATSEDDFVAKAHDFVDHPPAGAETLKRANGDTLVYDAKSNLFAVVAKDGAPRTIFKPRDGAAYWAQQKTEQDQPYSGYSRTASKTGGGDNG